MKSEFRKGVARVSDPTRSTAGKNPQLTTVENAVAYTAWNAACARAPSAGASRARPRDRVVALNLRALPRRRTPRPEDPKELGGVLPWSKQDHTALYNAVWDALAADARTAALPKPAEDTLRHVLSKAVGAASRRDGTASGHPPSRKTLRGASPPLARPPLATRH